MTNLPGSPSKPDWPENALREETIEKLFDCMLSKWGKQFVDKWSVMDADKLMREWGRALYGLSELEFRRGVSKLNSFDRPPNLPEFLKVCRPDVNPVSAYYEAIEGCRSREQGEVGTWSHPAIFWAAVRVSAYELKNQTYSQIRMRWEAALAAELAKNQWSEIPAPMIAIPAPAGDKLSREKATKMMEQVIATNKNHAGASQIDHKRWAKVILQRKKNGDKSLSPIQVQFAQEALKISKDDESE